MPVRDAHDRLREGELRLAVRVVDAPVRTDLALRALLPWLVEGFHHVVDVALLRCAIEKAPQEQRLVRGAGDGRFARASVARPAHLANDDLLARERPLQ